MNLSQQQLQSLLLPLFSSSTDIYEKYQPVYARIAKAEECITTEVNGKKETVNVANTGDYIVKNIASDGEQYSVAADRFPDLYRFSESVDDSWDAYLPKGQVKALEVDHTLLELLKQQASFHIVASWDELQLVEFGDKLVMPLPKQDEIYRIADSVFQDTYRVRD